jgi:hypothetical protein
MRLRLERDCEHLIGRRHLEIERLVNFSPQSRDVFVTNVTPILSQMRGNSVSPCSYRQSRRADGIRMPPAPRVADGGDMVDIDTEAKLLGHVVIR